MCAPDRWMVCLPRYHFHVHDGSTRVDADGTDLPDLQAARREALKRAGAIIGDAGARADFGEEWRLEVTDHAGLMLFRMDFVVAASPAAAHSRKPT